VKKSSFISSGDLPYISLIFLGLLLYSNTFHNSFHFDDILAIVDNPYIYDCFNFKSIWNAFNTRFVIGLSLAWNYNWGKLDVFGYHLFNILTHILASCLVYQFSSLTFETPFLSDNALYRHKKYISFLSAAIFLTHPIQTEAVTYIWQRATSLTVVFYLATMVFYAKARLCRSKFDYLAAIVFAAIGMFSKEIMFTAPIALALYEFCFFKKDPGNNRINRFYKVLPFLLLLFVIPLTLLRAPQVTLSLLKSQSESSNPYLDFGPITHAIAEKDMPRSTYVLTQINVLRTYLRLLFFPMHQNLDYDYPLSHSFFEPRTLFSFILLLCVMGGGFLLFKKNRLAAYAVFWFFLTLSVESLVPLHDVIFEHRLYLPMVGFSIFVTWSVFFFFRKQNAKIPVFFLMALTLIYSFLTYQRNVIWKDEVSLWSDVIAKSPHKVRSYINRGTVYVVLGKLDQALSDYNVAIEINPKIAVAYNNRGSAYAAMGKQDQAFSDFSKAIEIDPKNWNAYNNRGIAYAAMGKQDQAFSDFNKAIEIDPKEVVAYNNRGNYYAAKGKLDQAFLDFNKAIEIQPKYADAYNSRGSIYVVKGRMDLAFLDYSKAIEADSRCEVAYFKRGNIYVAAGKSDQALSDYNKAIEINPKNADFYKNRASIYYQLGQYDKSRRDAHRAKELGAKLDPRFLGALEKAFAKNKGSAG